MKILMVVSWYSPKDAAVMSAGVFHYEQSIALQKYCQMALYYPYDATLPCDYSKAEEKGLLTYRRRLSAGKPSKLNKLLELFRELRYLRRVCRDFQPDIIHAHCAYPAGRAAVLYSKLTGIPVMLTEHTPMEQMHMEQPKAKRTRGFAYENSRANVCVSLDSMTRLKEAFPECDFQVIYNGIIDPNTVQKDGKTYAIAGKVNCCIVAAFYDLHIKGYQYLLPAIRQLKDSGMDIVLHICGGGDYLEHYQNLAKELDIQDNCIFYGSCPREKVYSIVSQMDFNISASIFECSGVSVEEAMLLGKPLVVTRSGGANSLVSEDTAIVVDRGAVQPLADGIRQMATSTRFRPETIQAYGYENFEIDNVSRQYHVLYQSVLEKKK